MPRGTRGESLCSSPQCPGITPPGSEAVTRPRCNSTEQVAERLSCRAASHAAEVRAANGAVGPHIVWSGKIRPPPAEFKEG
jgi:hypothetical protein